MRLPVILVQNPPASAAAQAEALVGNLIGRAGLDLTLVNRFDSIASDSTDRMTLEGITVPSAVLDWRDPDEAIALLQKIDFIGYRCPHRLDPDASSPDGTSSRRLFLFDLTRHTDVSAVIAELDRLRESLSVKTVSLGNLSPRSVVSPKRESLSETRSTVTSPPSAEPVVQHPLDLASDASLDALIDQLDDMDV